MQELSRLFYVAATRAADYLILSAGVEDATRPRGRGRRCWQGDLILASGLFREEAGRSTGEREEVAASRPFRGCRAAWNVCLGRIPGRRRATGPSDGHEPEVDAQPLDLRPRRDLAENRGTGPEDGRKRPRPAAVVPLARRGRPRGTSAVLFSRLSGRLHAHSGGQSAFGGDEPPAEPALDPRGLGTLVHAVLAEIDFARPGNVGEIVRRLAEQHLPHSAGCLDEPIEMIERFLATPRAGQLAAAGELHRELEFLLAWPPGEEAAAAGRASHKTPRPVVAHHKTPRPVVAQRRGGRRSLHMVWRDQQ